MQFIIKSPEITDEMVDAEMRKEIRKSIKEEVIGKEKEREIMAAGVVKAMKDDKTHPVLGKRVAVMPAEDYFRLVKKYGSDEVASKEFLQYFQKRFPSLTPNKI
jgi:hypothetical protein